MRLSTDLFLLQQNISSLIETHFFDLKIVKFLKEIHSVTQYVIENQSSLGIPVVAKFNLQLWQAQSYLAGSSANETPFEMQYCLSKAIPEWVGRPCVITNAMSLEKDFHFFGVDIWQTVKTAIPGYDSSRFDALLVHMALPRLYRYRPIFCIPLYHELGHFVDHVHRFTQSFMLSNPTTPLPASSISDARMRQFILGNHLKEHFADLFAASYCGESSIRTLMTIAPNAAASQSHPSTAERTLLVANFLNNKSDPLIDLFQQHLCLRRLPPLARRFDDLNLAADFDDLLPCTLRSDRELHGIFDAAWNYLDRALTTVRPNWAGPTDSESIIEKTVNDLTEKSIRNVAVIEAWENGSSN